MGEKLALSASAFARSAGAGDEPAERAAAELTAVLDAVCAECAASAQRGARVIEHLLVPQDSPRTRISISYKCSKARRLRYRQ